MHIGNQLIQMLNIKTKLHKSQNVHLNTYLANIMGRFVLFSYHVLVSVGLKFLNTFLLFYASFIEYFFWPKIIFYINGWSKQKVLSVFSKILIFFRLQK